jgi:hypothetical protein
MAKTSWLQNLDIAFEVICPGLALIVTALRVYARLKIGAFGLGKLTMFCTVVVGSSPWFYI